MALVPKEMVSAYYQLNKPEHRAEDNIHGLLQQKEMPDDVKAKLLGQLVTKYHRLMEPKPEKKFEFSPDLLQTLEPPETDIPDLAPVPFAIVKYLGHAVPKSRKKFILPILEKLKEVGISFNDANELVVNNKPVFRSNLIDLFAYLMTSSQKPGVPPKGFDNFYRAIYESNIPIQWIGNKYLRDQLSIADVDPHMSQSKSPASSRIEESTPQKEELFSPISSGPAKRRKIKWVPWETP